MKKVLKIFLLILAVFALGVGIFLGISYLHDKSMYDDGSIKHIVVDFAKESSENRFTVYNENGTVCFSCKCLHGNGKGSTAKTPVFSNERGSNCSCLGKFEIIGFHTKYSIKCLELKGLDKSNSNAKIRGIYIHNSYWVTAYKDIPFFNIPLNGKASSGCFAIDNASMDKLLVLYNNHRLKYITATYEKDI